MRMLRLPALVVLVVAACTGVTARVLAPMPAVSTSPVMSAAGARPEASAPTAPTSAGVAATPQDQPAEVVFISPTLRIFKFGTAAGMPLTCSTAVSAVGQVAAGAGLSQTVAEPITQIAVQCGQYAAQFTGYIDQGRAAVAPLAAINPALNPVIDALAAGLRQAGHDYGASIAPFGPTVTESAATVEYFKGDG
jgi:hypothetical protein